MKNIRKRLLASVVAMTLACSMLPMTAFAADEEAAAEEPVVVEATTPEPAEPTAVISNEELPAAVVSEPAEAPAEETVTEEPAAEEPVAEEIVEKFGEYLGYALANLAAVTDPAVIVIGGGVSRAGEIPNRI